MSGIRDIWIYANHVINSARQMINEKLQPLQLGSAEGNILLHLLTCEQVLRQEDLVKELEITKAAISRALASLEKKGLILRKKDLADKRVSNVFLTAKGQAIAPQVREVYEEVFTIAAQGMEEKEIVDFIGIFRRISANFEHSQPRKE